MLSENEVLALMKENGLYAEDILDDFDPNIKKRFKRIDKTLIKLLEDVRKEFPDAEFYTASGGLTLMLGNSHNKETGKEQSDLIALNGNVFIGDGDF